MLETLAYGGGDQSAEVRLRAVEALQREPSVEDEPEIRVDDHEAQLLLDLWVTDALDSVVGLYPPDHLPPVDVAEARQAFPMALDAIRFAIETRARELADRDRIDAEIRQRAEALAADMYIAGGVGRLEMLLDQNVTDEPRAPSETPQREAGSLPDGLSPDDLTRPWATRPKRWSQR
jgi:hypothetical protein